MIKSRNSLPVLKWMTRQPLPWQAIGSLTEMKTVAWSCLFDDERFVQRINKFRKQRLNKRVKKITTKTKIIGKIPNSEKKSKINNNKRGEDVKDKE